jgi:hypothetical protein
MRINVLSLLGALGIVVGSFLPWYTEVFSTGSRLVQYGLEDGDGNTTLIFGVVLLILALLAGNSRNRLKLAIEGFLSVYVVVLAALLLIVSSEVVKQRPGNTWGPGLWILAGGAALHLIVYILGYFGFRTAVLRLEK